MERLLDELQVLERVGGEELVQVVEGLSHEAIELGVLADPSRHEAHSRRGSTIVSSKPCEPNRNGRMVRQPGAGDQRVGGHGSWSRIQQVHGDQIRIDAIKPTHSRCCSVLVELHACGVGLGELNELRQELVKEASQWLSLVRDTL